MRHSAFLYSTHKRRVVRMGWGLLNLHSQFFKFFGFDVHNLAFVFHNEVTILFDGALNQAALCKSHTVIDLLLKLLKFQITHNSIIFWYDSGSKISFTVSPVPQAMRLTSLVPLLS